MVMVTQRATLNAKVMGYPGPRTRRAPNETRGPVDRELIAAMPALGHAFARRGGCAGLGLLLCVAVDASTLPLPVFPR